MVVGLWCLSVLFSLASGAPAATRACPTCRATAQCAPNGGAGDDSGGGADALPPRGGACPAADEHHSIVIVGAGPTGLGAATRLHQLGADAPDWVLLEGEGGAGGLSMTDTTAEGFLFDMGGHVIFSHWQYFDDLLDHAYGSGDAHWTTLQRVSHVRYKGRYVPYPFQNNIAKLPAADQVRALVGLAQAQVLNARLAHRKPATFDEWILRLLGEGIADIFMRPYNFKVWATETTRMQAGWLGERVATVNLTRAIGNVIHQREDAGWGPNAVFRFPRRGGTGGIWKAVAAKLPTTTKPPRVQYNRTVVGLDADAKRLTLAGGATVSYDRLLSTMPLDVLLRMVGQGEWADELFFSNSHIIGVGVRGTHAHYERDGAPMCWLYYPEDNCPYYRATVFSAYSPENCPADAARLPTLRLADRSRECGHNGGAAAAAGGPEAAACGKVGVDTAARGGPYWSLMFEVSESVEKWVNQTEVEVAPGLRMAALVEETVRGAIATGLLRPGDEIVSLYHRRLHHGYPTPRLERDGTIGKALPWLRERDIWSRGRFGSYKYEVGNQDHSLILGVEAVDNMLSGAKEMALHHPGIVNDMKRWGGKNRDLVFTPPWGEEHAAAAPAGAFVQPLEGGASTDPLLA